MALHGCQVLVDDNGRELLEHGSLAFPIAFYHDDLRLNQVPWHWHEEWEAAIITEGSALVAGAGKRNTIQAGEGFFINSAVLHGCWAAGSEGSRFHSMAFHPRLIGGNGDSIFHQKYVRPMAEHTSLAMVHLKPSISWQKEILDLIEAAWQAGVRENGHYDLQIRDYLSRITALLLQNIPEEEAPVDSRSTRDLVRIKQMMQFIHQNYGGPITVAQIADSVSVSESECLRCFRRTIGLTPIRYLNDYRLRMAAQLLRSTSMQVSDIAVACGFSDVSYFTKCFREQQGISPAASRKGI